VQAALKMLTELAVQAPVLAVADRVTAIRPLPLLVLAALEMNMGLMALAVVVAVAGVVLTVLHQVVLVHQAAIMVAGVAVVAAN
jgi:hypothetical protein